MMKQSNKYGTIRVVGRWLDIIPQILVQWRVFMYYAFVLTIISIVSNRWTYACHGHSGGFWCYWYNGSNIAYICSVLLSFLAIISVFGMFASDFYKGLVAYKPLGYKEISAVDKEKIKSGMIFVGATLLFGVLLGIIAYIVNPPELEKILNYVLKQWNLPPILLHGANENWQIEFIFFLIAFICLMIPLLFMRCFAVVAYWFNEKRASLAQLYEMTFDRAYVGIFCFLLLALLCTVQHLSIINYFNKLIENYNYLTVAFFSEFCNNLLILLYLALFLLLSQAEYLQLKANQAEVAAITEIISEPEVAEEFSKKENKKSLKSAKKKKSIRKAKQSTKKAEK